MTIQHSKTKMLVFFCSILIAVALFFSCNNAAEPATSTKKDTADTKPVGDPPNSTNAARTDTADTKPVGDPPVKN